VTARCRSMSIHRWIRVLSAPAAMHSSAKPWELVLKYGEGGVVQVVADQAQVQVPALWAAVGALDPGRNDIGIAR
jgi:hypothetical protein